MEPERDGEGQRERGGERKEGVESCGTPSLDLMAQAERLGCAAANGGLRIVQQTEQLCKGSAHTNKQ